MNRRLHNRIDALPGAEEQVFIENNSELLAGKLSNLSAGGLLLVLNECEVSFLAGDRFNVLFENGGQLIGISATVVRSNGEKIAFQFLDMTPEQKRAIHTKLIRMGIISARLRSAEKRQWPDPGAPEIRQRSEGVPISQDPECEPQKTN
jgi:c-di-GMP-binding flagellar brake protein YcgR